MTTQKFPPRDHILGRFSEEKLDLADERSLSDPAYFEALIAEEQLLVEEYAASQLTGKDRDDFESQCALRPELRERVLIEQLLRRRAGKRSSRLTAWMRIALPLAASLALVAGGAAWHYSQQLAQERRFAKAREHEWKDRETSLEARIGQLENAPRSRNVQLPRAPAPKPPAVVLASNLIHAYTLGGAGSEEPRYNRPRGEGVIECNFNIGTDSSFERYRISIRKRNGATRSFLASAHDITLKEGEEQNTYRVVTAQIPNSSSGEEHFDVTAAGVTPGSPDQLIESYAFALEAAKPAPPAAK